MEDELWESLLSSTVARHYLAPAPDSVPRPSRLLSPLASELPLPFLQYSGLSGFVVGYLRFVGQPLGDPHGYVKIVGMLRTFEYWWLARHWQFLL